MPEQTPTQELRSRRALLGAAAAGAIGLTAARLGVPADVEAATGDMQYGTDNDAGDAETTLTSTNPFRTFKASGSGAYAIAGEGTGAESTGVVGIGSGPGTGVRGQSAAGIGVLAESTTGRGLAVDGRAAFLTGGAVAIPAGKSELLVLRPWVNRGSFVVATIQGDRSGVWVRGVSVGDGRFRIRLNKAVTSVTKVAFLVFEQVALPED